MLLCYCCVRSKWCCHAVVAYCCHTLCCVVARFCCYYIVFLSSVVVDIGSCRVIVCWWVRLGGLAHQKTNNESVIV